MILFQFNFRNQTFAFKFKIGFSIFCLFFLVLFCCLGVWQLHRYAAKKTLLTQYQENIKANPIPLVELMGSVFPAQQAGIYSANPHLQGDDTGHLSFHNVQVEGEYLNQFTMFLQNRFYKDQLGYDVLTPFHIKGDATLLLIDRGWIAARNNNQLPAEIKPALSSKTVTGYIKLLNEYQFMLGKNILNPDEKPLVMQKIDMTELGHILHQSFYPFVLRLNAKASDGFIRDWPIVMVMPERHMMYAIQWFVMAVVLLIAYCGFCVNPVIPTQARISPAKNTQKKMNSQCGNDRIKVPLFVMLVFLVPMILSYFLYFYRDNFHFKTTNYGQLITHPFQLDLNHQKKWQVVLVTPSLCDSVCKNQFFFLKQMRLLLGKDADRVDILQIPIQQNEKLSVNQIYLIDPLHNVFMQYPNTANVMNILKDLKKVLEVSQIG